MSRMEVRLNPLDAASERINELEAQLAAANRLATDRLYFMQAYEQMLGPIGLKVVAMWRDKRVHRVHHSWGPQAHNLTGEERAQVILDMEEAAKTAVRVESIDGPSGRLALSKEGQ
jgi:hypothetical protein